MDVRRSINYLKLQAKISVYVASFLARKFLAFVRVSKDCGP